MLSWLNPAREHMENLNGNPACIQEAQVFYQWKAEYFMSNSAKFRVQPKGPLEWLITVTLIQLSAADFKYKATVAARSLSFP